MSQMLLLHQYMSPNLQSVRWQGSNQMLPAKAFWRHPEWEDWRCSSPWPHHTESRHAAPKIAPQLVLGSTPDVGATSKRNDYESWIRVLGSIQTLEFGPAQRK
jgi:hypothetical protein